MVAALRSLQRSIFRKNGLIKLIVVTSAVDGIVLGMNKQSRGELKQRQTDRQTDRPNYRNPRCACAPRVNKVQNHQHQLYAGPFDVHRYVYSMHCCNFINWPGHGSTYLAGHTLWTTRLGPTADLSTEPVSRRLAASVAFRAALNCTLVGPPVGEGSDAAENVGQWEIAKTASWGCAGSRVYTTYTHVHR